MLNEHKNAFKDGVKNRWTSKHYIGPEKLSYMFGRTIHRIDKNSDIGIHDDISEFSTRWRTAENKKTKLLALFASRIPGILALISFIPIYFCEEIGAFMNMVINHPHFHSLKDIFVDSIITTGSIVVPICQFILIGSLFQILSSQIKTRYFNNKSL